MKNFTRWWFTPKFPKYHVEKVLNYKPEGFFKLVKDRYRTWVVHPIKRRISRLYLKLLKKLFGIKIIGITGSAGKSTIKEMVASILKQDGETVYSFANIDPIYNIPTTILKCRPSTKYLILEMGVEYPGEMDFYLWLARPDIGVITNIYPTHTLFFGDIQGVLVEKSKLVRKFGKNQVAVLNYNNDLLKKLGKKLRCKVLWFGENSEIRAEKVIIKDNLSTKFTLADGKDKISIQLPVLGEQYVENALASTAVGCVLGLSLQQIKKGLEKYKSPEHRMHVIKHRSGAVVLDDSYNNNPEAAKKALEVFKEIRGQRKSVLVFGDMLELGKGEIEYHREIGRQARKDKIDYVIGVGPLSKNVARKQRYWARTWQDAVPLVKPLVQRNTIILVKGSRSIGLDQLVDVILQ